MHFFTDLENDETQKKSFKILQDDSANLLKTEDEEDSLLFEIENSADDEFLGGKNSKESDISKEKT